MNTEADTGYFYIHCRATRTGSLAESVAALRRAFANACRERGARPEDAFCLRFFCSDVHRQAEAVRRLWPVPPATLRLFIGQPPLDSRHVSVQAAFLPGAVRKPLEGGGVALRHGGYETFLRPFLSPRAADAETQTDDAVAEMRRFMTEQKLDMTENLLRTWYYVRDVDNNYAGMIRSRIRHYEACGLTPKTHFTASTGIEACAETPHLLSWLVAEMQRGLVPDQVRYLKALSHLSPTHVYGVNFERAAAVQYGECRHIRLSGTASIDAAGRIAHEGNVVAQLDRTVENIAALLEEGGMDLSRMRSAVVYLRDAHDYPLAAPRLASIFPEGCALSVVHAPVCRPGWLIEIEGEALAPIPDARRPRLNGGM